ncbi:DUF983 domain-containing protein [Azospirillum sp. YIM DDC1]|uniref:DUF983 domain-containing protein n=1 Tax=Azospirillum aestuarii TaxID=2802052 RepID=A0ABS1HZN4_9PROT|nr:MULTISPECIES: DUF983 domain-containing protein [Azospirillum]AWJ84898.1 hypothetical protein TSH58p_16055 [Azospirillum sp. TSH58]MBK4720161.1 DUF983 domain-containing protein [Azospirillum aestuarii]PWC58841.1 hypothetical protein TSH58_30120 [Azospirillum sp. TSH58]
MSTYYTSPSPLTAGLRCACPRCGRGKLFDGYLTVNERCSVCNLNLARQDSGDGPAVFLIFILGFLVVPVALWVSMTVDWPLWLHAIVWSIVVLGLALGMLRPAKAYVVALQYRHRRNELEDPDE